MGKLTRQETKVHDQAMDLVHSDKTLTTHEIELILHEYDPRATTNVSKSGAFFTPFDLAWNFAAITQPKGRVIDLCAGIGMLTYQILKHDRGGGTYKGDIREMVAVELNPEYLAVGKRILPDVTWIEGSILDAKLMSSLGVFDCSIGNPPFGNVMTRDGKDWMLMKGPFEWLTLEIVARISHAGALIVPRGCSGYNYQARPLNIEDPVASFRRNYQKEQNTKNKDKFLKLFPGTNLMPASVDTRAWDNDWKGANPSVEIMDVNFDDTVAWSTPFGFGDVEALKPPKTTSEQASMFA